MENLFGEVEKTDYDKFVDKFKTKKTTDDCYTPPAVYRAVADWVAKEYSLDPATFFRPFYPGGDYAAEDYTGKVVVDNPPFSILAEIERFYVAKKIPFFLFAPTLTLFSPNVGGVTFLPTGVAVTYENGANINTSFVTNLQGEDIVVRTAPELYRSVCSANKELEKVAKKQLPKYEYPDYIVTAAMASRWCRHGVEYTLRGSDCIKVGGLDKQKAVGKSIFGGGYLLSERAAAERAAAERAAAERAAAERAAAERAAAERAAAEVWQLSDKERRIVASLSGEEVEDEVPPLFS